MEAYTGFNTWRVFSGYKQLIAQTLFPVQSILTFWNKKEQKGAPALLTAFILLPFQVYWTYYCINVERIESISTIRRTIKKFANNPAVIVDKFKLHFRVEYLYKFVFKATVETDLFIQGGPPIDNSSMTRN